MLGITNIVEGITGREFIDVLVIVRLIRKDLQLLLDSVCSNNTLSRYLLITLP